MASDADMGSWTDLLHSSSKLVEQAAPSAQFPPLQRNLDQLEALSKKLKAKTLRTEAPTQSIAATRLLAREGINAEQLARDLKSFELKATFEDVFPAEATSMEEYLQQVHEMAMVSAIQEAQKDNLRSFNDYMMTVLEEDWQKEKRDFLQSLSGISSLPKTNLGGSSTAGVRPGQIVSLTSSPLVSSAQSSMEIAPLANKPLLEKKAASYAEVIKNLNSAREHGLPFKPATAFKAAYESLGLDASSGKSVSMQKIWHLIQTLMGEGSAIPWDVSKKMSLVIGARRHLEWGHEKYIIDTIQSHPAQAALGGVVGNLQRIRAFLRIRLRDYGVLDFDAGDACRQPPVDTTWQQIYFCLRTGYYDEAKNVALSSRVSHHFAPQLSEWIATGGMVSPETAAAASEECEKLLRMGDRVGRAAYDKKKLLLFAIISGSRRHIDRLLRESPTLFNTIEDFLWFKLSAIRDCPGGSSSVVLNEGYSPYSLDDLQVYLNKFEPSYYTKNGKDPLVYPYVLLLSIQLLPAVLYLSKDTGDEGFNIDAVHISIVLADHGVLSVSAGPAQKLGVMDAFAEASSIIRQYGSVYLRHDNLSMALEYYVLAAAAVGGGQLSWSGRGNTDQQRQRSLMLKQLLTEVLLRDGGVYLLLGPRGAGGEGELGRFLTDGKTRQQFLLEAACQCQEAGLYDKSIEIQKRVGAFAMALDTINKCLSEAICALSRGRLDGESRTAGLIHSGNEILETYKYYPEVSGMEVEDWASSSGGTSDSEVCVQDTNDEEHYFTSGDIPKLQFRKNISRACWDDQMGMAEIVERKGSMWATTGIVRGGKIYCSIEETLFLAERGELSLSDAADSSKIPLKDIYKKVAEGKCGCCWESFEVYRHLRSLGYIVGRHGIPWTLKSTKDKSASVEDKPEIEAIIDQKQEDPNLINELFNNLMIDEVRPIFDVYPPNSKFRKSSPGNPHFVLCITSGNPPSKPEIEDLERRCNGIPLKFCHAEHGRVSFFSFNRFELPVLP